MKAILTLALFLQVISNMACLDYQPPKMREELFPNTNHPPYIDYKSRIPSGTFVEAPIGEHCADPEFLISAYSDSNPNDVLYYIWRFDYEVVLAQNSIKPETRNITLPKVSLGKLFLQQSLTRSIDDKFLATPHTLELFLSNRKFLDAKNAISELSTTPARESWSIHFLDQACS